MSSGPAAAAPTTQRRVGRGHWHGSWNGPHTRGANTHCSDCMRAVFAQNSRTQRPGTAGSALTLVAHVWLVLLLIRVGARREELQLLRGARASASAPALAEQAAAVMAAGNLGALRVRSASAACARCEPADIMPAADCAHSCMGRWMNTARSAAAQRGAAPHQLLVQVNVAIIHGGGGVCGGPLVGDQLDVMHLGRQAGRRASGGREERLGGWPGVWLNAWALPMHTTCTWCAQQPSPSS